LGSDVVAKCVEASKKWMQDLITGHGCEVHFCQITGLLPEIETERIPQLGFDGCLGDGYFKYKTRSIRWPTLEETIGTFYTYDEFCFGFPGYSVIPNTHNDFE
jgi:hypothetical protein